jgi:isocitrate/isopropylmalate dehydrogenase
MIKERKSFQNQIEVVMLENLVPQDHLSRLIDQYIDFSFIRELTKDLYCLDNEYPDIDSYNVI